MSQGKSSILIKLFIVLVLVANLVLLVTVYAFSESSSGHVIIFNMEATIDSGTEDLLSRTMSSLPKDTKAIIIVLNTNGGYLDATEAIVDLIMRSPVKVIVYVPAGGRAFSAGAYIAVSSDQLVMSPGSVIGSAEPRNIGGVKSDPKVVNAMASWIESLAHARRRNESAIRDMVIYNKDYTAEEAIRSNIADTIVSSLCEYLDLSGLSYYDTIYVKPDVRSNILSVLSDPFIVGLLVDLASVLILIEVFHPTYVGGVGAGVAFILALLGLGIVGTDATASILLLLGILSIILEIKIGHGGPAVIGSILIVFGTMLLYKKEYFIWTFNYTAFLTTGLVLIVVVTGIIGFYLHKIREVLMKRKSVLDLDLLVGEEGVAKTDISPSKPGIVLVKSDYWTANSDEEIKEGEKIKVIKVDGIKLYVKKAIQE